MAVQILIGMENDFEAVAVHPSAEMARRHLRQLMRGFQAETAPDMGVIASV